MALTLNKLKMDQKMCIFKNPKENSKTWKIWKNKMSPDINKWPKNLASTQDTQDKINKQLNYF